MALVPSWPGPTALTTTTDARKNLAGLVVKDTLGAARSGVFPAHANPLVTARADMNVDIAAFTGAGVQFGGPVLIANDGVAQLPSVLVSPGAGTNYYVIYAKQNESTSPGTDANNNRVFGAQLSTTSFAVARAALPAGAIELATAEMPTGKTATNQAGVVITQTHRYTAAAGGTVWVRDSTERAAWTPADGASVFEISSGRVYRRLGGAWLQSPIAEASGVVVCPNTAGGGVSPVFWSDLVDVTFPPGLFASAPNVFVNTIGPSGQVPFGGLVEQITTAGCKVRGMRISAVPTNAFSVEWYAVQA